MRPLPGIAVALIAVAVLLMWIVILLVLAAWVYSGGGVGDLDPLLPGSGLQDRQGLRLAFLFQWAITALGFLTSLLLGSWILLQHMRGALETASRAAVLLIRCLIAFQVLGVLAAFSIPVAMGGVGAALPALATTVPATLLVIAFLICAERHLKSAPDDVFA